MHSPKQLRCSGLRLRFDLLPSGQERRGRPGAGLTGITGMCRRIWAASVSLGAFQSTGSSRHKALSLWGVGRPSHFRVSCVRLSLSGSNLTIHWDFGQRGWVSTTSGSPGPTKGWVRERRERGWGPFPWHHPGGGCGRGQEGRRGCETGLRLCFIVVQLLSHVWLFCDPVDCSPPGSSVCGVLQARVLEGVAIPFSKGSSQPRDRTCVSCTGRRILNHWAIRKVLFQVNSRCKCKMKKHKKTESALKFSPDPRWGKVYGFSPSAFHQVSLLTQLEAMVPSHPFSSSPGWMTRFWPVLPANPDLSCS